MFQAEPVYSVVSDFFDPMDYKPTRLLCPWNFPGLVSQEWFPFPHPEYLPNPGIEPAAPAAPALIKGFFITEPPGKPVPGRENRKPLIAGG